jgi:hypothetical protein
MADQDLQRGFNSGYSLRARDPGLAAQFAQMLEGREDDYAKGFTAGLKEKEREFTMPRHRNYRVSRQPHKGQSQSRDRDKGLDMDER